MASNRLLKRIGKICLCLVLAVSASAQEGEELSVTANVDRNEMRPGDAFTYSVTVRSTNHITFSDPKLPEFKDFRLLNKWSSSETRGSFVQGQVQTEQVKTYNFQLVPLKEGKLEIGAAEVEIDGKTIRTNPIELNVSPSAPVGPSGPPGGQYAEPDPMDDVDEMFSQLLRRHLGRRQAIPQGDLNGDPFFIHVDVDKEQVYQNEQVTVSFYLVTNANILDIDTLKYPTLEGFWKEDLELATRLNFRPEIINGQRYNKALLASFALFPIKPGALKVDSYRAKCRVMGYNQLGFPQEAVLTKESPEIAVKVLPLPDNKPATFHGGVGEYSVTARADNQDIKTNQPFSYKLRVEGKGNAKFVDPPKINFPEGFEVYDTKSEMKFFANGRSYKEFETLLVPRSVGQFEIPTFEISFFDPASKKYYSRTVPSVAVDVKKGDDRELIPSATNLPLAESKEGRRRLPPISLSIGEPPTENMAFTYGLWGILFAAGIGGLSYFGVRELRPRDRRQDLRSRVRAKMSKIRAELDKGHWRVVGVESVNLISSTLGEIAGTGGASFEFAKLVAGAPPSFRRDVAPQLEQLMQKLQVVGFAPEDVVGAMKEKKALKELVNESEKLLLATCQYDFSSEEVGTV